MKGYFYKRNGIRNATWGFQVSVGKDLVTGKPKRISRSGFKTRMEAQLALKALLIGMNLEKGFSLKSHVHRMNCACKEACACEATWACLIDLGPDPMTGKQRLLSESGFKTSKEAVLAANALIAKHFDN